MPIRQEPINTLINNALLVSLEKTISPPRLGPYVTAAGHDKPRAVRLYLWNVSVGQSFHYPLQALEVTLRNAINEVLVTDFGGNWWRTRRLLNLLDKGARQSIIKARGRLRRLNPGFGTDDMVATLSFGFWVSFIAPRYYPKIWSARLGAVFPHKPAPITHRDIYHKANKALTLRNRIFHQEPLIGMNLSGDYAEILALLKWICPDTQGWVRTHTSVPQILRTKP